MVGSRAFGLDNEASDTDLRGIYLPPARAHGSLYGVQHDRDLLGTNWHKVFTMAQDASIPSE